MIWRTFMLLSIFFAPPRGRLRRVVVMAPPLAALALAGCCPESSVYDEIYLIRDPDPSLQPLVDACRDLAQPDCLPLCRALSGSSRFGVIQHCELHQDRSGYVQVHVGVREDLVCE